MKTFATLMLSLLCAVTALAQEQSIDYIYSSEGFKVVTVNCPMYAPGRSGDSQCVGLYSADGKVLVQAIYDTYGDRKGYFYVKEGTEVIASRAFQTFEGGLVYFPSTVTSIAPDAFTNYTAKGAVVMGIYNDAYEDQSRIAVPAKDGAEATEIGRYTIDGRQISRPEPGVNIVQMSDNTAQKVLAR